MCGIVAFMSCGPQPKPLSRPGLEAVLAAIAKRGPDDSGVWFSPDHSVGLGHRRLAIIDLSAAGHQPMIGEDEAVITYNGEIYNFAALREELVQRGETFKSNSDTEVLLHLFRLEGPAMLRRLEGMFSLAIYQPKTRRLFLARDPFGIKPLYWSYQNGCFRAASQVKALQADRALATSPSAPGQVGFYLWGHVPEPFTLYEEISSLAPGHFMWVSQDHGPEPAQCFWDPMDDLRNAPEVPEGGRDERLSNALTDSFQRHLVADVPIGLFLSGGKDSGLLAALAAKNSGNQVRAITLAFEDFAGSDQDESAAAATLARHYGLAHEIITLSKADFVRESRIFFAAMDQPSIDGLNSFLVCAAAKRAGLKVALTGLGGDELFGGYPSFHQVPKLARAPFARALNGISKGAQPLLGSFARCLGKPKLAGLLQAAGSFERAFHLRRGLYLPDEVSSILDAACVKEGLARLEKEAVHENLLRDIASPHAKVCALECRRYMGDRLLRDSDWAGMAHSLEVRTPFVDGMLFAALAPLIASERPPTKDEALALLAPDFPPALAKANKRGFVTPERSWLAALGYNDDRESAGSFRPWARFVMSQFITA